MAYQYPTTTNPLYRTLDAVLASQWTAGGTGANLSAPSWGGIGLNGGTSNRIAWASRPIDVDGEVNWRWEVESSPPIGVGGTGDRCGPGLVDAAGTNLKFWVFSANGTQLYIGTEVATVPTFTLIGAFGGASTGFAKANRGRITVVPGVIGAGVRACDLYISVDSMNEVLVDSDTIDASAVCIATQGITTVAAGRIQVALITEKKIT
jgi:hypothetical protein